MTFGTTTREILMKPGEIVELLITSLGKHGEGVAILKGLPIFVDGALPEEKVMARIHSIKPTYANAQLLSIINTHKQRVAPVCARFDSCGGCQVMHLSYEGQLHAKNNLVKEAFMNGAGLTQGEILPCIPSVNPFHYRNKIQLPVSRIGNNLVAGFYRRGSHEIIPYEHCLVHHEVMEKSAAAIRNLIQDSPIETYCEITQKGTLRHFIMRANQKGELLLGFVTNGKQNAQIRQLAAQIQSGVANVVGVVENINTKKQNTILGDKTILLSGSYFLTEEIDNLSFKISLPSFFQINFLTSKILYDIALSFAQIHKDSVVLDAYCGIGTMTLLAARECKNIIGAECVEEAVLDARENARINGITNAQFVNAKLEEHIELFRGIDTALINPPRQGLNVKVVEALNNFGPQRFVYISCNPHTLARDAQMLKEYHLKKIQPVDMFPQTMHVESVALFERQL